MDIELRPITKEDADKIVNWRNQDFVLQYFIDQRKLTKESQMKYYETQIKTGKVVQWIIQVDGKDIGTCFLKDFDKIKKTAEYGVFIGEKEYLSQGIGKRCVKEVLNKAFFDMGLEHVFVRIQQKNPRSINSFSASGFRKNKRIETKRINGKDEIIIFLDMYKEDYQK